MALTYNAPLHKRSIGGDYLLVASITTDNSYPTGGYTLDLTLNGSFPLGVVKAMWPAGHNSTAKTTTVAPVFNYTTGKLLMYWSTTAAVSAEVANTTDLSTYTFVFCVIGK